MSGDPLRDRSGPELTQELVHGAYRFPVNDSAFDAIKAARKLYGPLRTGKRMVEFDPVRKVGMRGQFPLRGAARLGPKLIRGATGALGVAGAVAGSFGGVVSGLADLGEASREGQARAALADCVAHYVEGYVDTLSRAASMFETANGYVPREVPEDAGVRKAWEKKGQADAHAVLTRLGEEEGGRVLRHLKTTHGSKDAIERALRRPVRDISVSGAKPELRRYLVGGDPTPPVATPSPRRFTPRQLLRRDDLQRQEFHRRMAEMQADQRRTGFQRKRPITPGGPIARVGAATFRQPKLSRRATRDIMRTGTYVPGVWGTEVSRRSHVPKPIVRRSTLAPTTEREIMRKGAYVPGVWGTEVRRSRYPQPELSSRTLNEIRRKGVYMPGVWGDEVRRNRPGRFDINQIRQPKLSTRAEREIMRKGAFIPGVWGMEISRSRP